MLAKLIFGVGVLGVGGYVGTTMINHDPSIIPLSRADIETKLVDAKTVLPRRDGPGEISIWSTGRSKRGVDLAMRYSDDSPLIECEAVIEVVAADRNRVTADCGGDPADPSAISKTTDALRPPMFQEHISATLQARPFDRKRVDKREMGVVLGGVGDMRKEALQRADEAQRDQANAAN